MTSRPGTASPQQPAIRRLPPGISGEDLQRSDAAALRRGAIWLRGCQRVQIRGVTPHTITVAELDHGVARRRRIPRAAFLRTSRPEVVR